jgi:hypothetical protein
MAIRLTPKQQKASFSAFDTSTSAGEGFQAFSREAGRAAETLSNYATSMEQKRKKAQTILARNADANRYESVARATQAYNDALSSGNQERIDSAYNEYNTVTSTPLANFVPEDAGSRLEDNSIIDSFDAAFKKQTSVQRAKLESQRHQRVILKDATNQLENFNLALTTAFNESGGNGLSESKLAELFNHPFLSDADTGYVSISEGLTEEGSQAYRNEIRKSVLSAFKTDLEDTLNPDELQKKREAFSQFVSNNPSLQFSVADVDFLDDQYKKSLETAQDPKALIDRVEGEISANIPALEASIAAPNATASDNLQNYVRAADLLEQVAQVLPEGNEKRKRLNAVVGLLKLTSPDTETDPETNEVRILMDQPTTYQTMLQEMMDADTPELFIEKDALNKHADVSGNGLDSSAVSKLSDKLATDRDSMMREIKRGDSSFIRKLSPQYDALYKIAQGGGEHAKSAREQLQLLYSKYAKENPKAFGLSIPKQLYVPLMTPVPKSLNRASMIQRMDEEIDQNNVPSANSYAAAQLNNGVSTINEQAYYQILWAKTNLEMTGGNPDLINSAAEMLEQSEKATPEDKKLVRKLLDESDLLLAATYRNALLTGDPNYAGALNLYMQGMVFDSESKDDYDDLVDHIQKREQDELVPLFGYTTNTDSSAYVAVPPVVLSKYADFNQMPYIKGMFARLGASYNNKMDPDTVSDLYTDAVVGLIANKYNMNEAAKLELLVDSYDMGSDIEGQFLPMSGGYFPTSPAQKTLDDKEAMFGIEKRPFVRAVVNGFKNNTRTVGTEERPVARLSLPVIEVNSQGKREQRIYFEVSTGSRSFKKVQEDGGGELMYVTLSEVDTVLGQAVRRYTSPVAQLLGTEEMFASGLTKQSGRLNTVLDIMQENAGMDALTPSELPTEE